MRRLTRKFLSSLVAALMLSSLFAGSAAAAGGGNCLDYGSNYHVGQVTSPGLNVTGAQAYVDPYVSSTSFALCSGWGGIAYNDGVSGWVSIEPGSGNTQYGSSSAIIQIGVINCESTPNFWAACAGGGQTLRYFWATGGCNALPHPQDLGLANSATHLYKIEKVGNDWKMYIDGSLKKTVLSSDSSTSCWLGQSNKLRAAYMGERLDRGDSLGNSSTEYLYIYSTKLKIGTGSYAQITPSCNIRQPASGTGQSKCATTSTGLKLWSQY